MIQIQSLLVVGSLKQLAEGANRCQMLAVQSSWSEVPLGMVHHR